MTTTFLTLIFITGAVTPTALAFGIAWWLTR